MINKRTVLSVILIAAIAIPVMSVFYVEEAEAASTYLEMDTGSLEIGDFDTRNAGDVKITIKNNTEDNVSVRVWLTYQNKTDVIKETTVEVLKEDKAVAVLNVKFDSQGAKSLTIWAESEDASFYDGSPQSSIGHNFTLGVSQSVWSNATTYIAIVAIVIIIAVAVYIKHRSAPKAEPGITFTELEEQRRSQRKGVESSKAPSAEKKKYEGGQRKNR